MRLVATLPDGWCSTAPGVWRHVDGAVAELGRLVPMLTVARVMRHFVSSVAAGEVATVAELPVSLDGPGRLFRVVVTRGRRLVETRLVALYQRADRLGVISVRAAGALPDEALLLRALDGVRAEWPTAPPPLDALLAGFGEEPPCLGLFSYLCD